MLHLCVKQGIVVEAELPPYALAMVQNFRSVGVFFARHMAGFFEQRHIDHRRRIALRAGITVPIPGAAKIATLLDDANIRYARFDQPCARNQTTKAATDKGKGYVIGLWLPFPAGSKAVLQIVSEPTFQLQVLIIAVRPQAFIPFLAVFFP